MERRRKFAGGQRLSAALLSFQAAQKSNRQRGTTATTRRHGRSPSSAQAGTPFFVKHSFHGGRGGLTSLGKRVAAFS